MKATKKCIECHEFFTIDRQPSVVKRTQRCSKLCANRSNGRKAVSRIKEISRNRQPAPSVFDEYAVMVIGKCSQLIVDLEDFETTRNSYWELSSGGYAQRTTPKSERKSSTKHVRLHRDIMTAVLGRELERNEFVDHINRNKLDNRRSNLRLASHSQNMFNVGKRKNSSSQYKGVSRLSANGKWRAGIMVDCVNVAIIVSESEEEAAWMRDQWALQLHGEFAVLNFEYV